MSFDTKKYTQDYEAPEDIDQFVNTDKGEIIDKKDVSPFEIIKIVAKKNGYDINDPKENCKHCYGRGYTGKDSSTGMPIPCNCIYPKTEDREMQKKMAEEYRIKSYGNRRYRRKIQRLLKKAKKKKLIKQQNAPNKDKLQKGVEQSKPVKEANDA